MTVLALGLVACGDDNDDSSQDTGAQSTAPTTTGSTTAEDNGKSRTTEDDSSKKKSSSSDSSKRSSTKKKSTTTNSGKGDTSAGSGSDRNKNAGKAPLYSRERGRGPELGARRQARLPGLPADRDGERAQEEQDDVRGDREELRQGLAGEQAGRGVPGLPARSQGQEGEGLAVARPPESSTGH